MASEKTPRGRAIGGVASRAKLTPEERSESARKAALAKSAYAKLPKATHGSIDHPLRIGDIEISCYVLEDGTRVLSQNALQTSIGMSLSGGVNGEQRIVGLLTKIEEKGVIINDLAARIKSPILFRPPHGGNAAYGFEATVLADICEALLVARGLGNVLTPSQIKYADQAEILIRGFARVGIIALVDEATGYQKDRAKDALAKILEAYVAKELQPWMRTFPSDYYEQLFRLYNIPFPPEKPQWRPSFIGKITNNVVYERLAPDLLPELKLAASKAERKTRLHQWLTSEMGHPKLREHLSSIVTLLKISNSPEQFKQLVDQAHPRFGDTYSFDFKE